MIRFDYLVVDARATRGNECHGWEITIGVTAVDESKVTIGVPAVDESKVKRFDAVIAANGHYGRLKAGEQRVDDS